MRRQSLGGLAVLAMTVTLWSACTARSQVSSVIEGFFTQVNQSNFETAKSKYLSSLLISTLNSPSGSHRTPQESFKEMLGKIKGVEVQGAEVTGETATAAAILVMPWGSKWRGRMELVKEGGREWKISDWEEFKMVGHEHLAKAMQYCGSRNQNQAIPEYEAALAENPKDAFVALMWGICYMQSVNLPAAEKKLKEVVEMSPDFSSEAHFTLSAIYVEQGKVADAESAVEKGTRSRSITKEKEVKRLRAAAYSGLATLYVEKGMKLDKAVELAQTTLSLLPEGDFMQAYVLDTLGQAYHKKGDRAQAIKYLQQALRGAPGNEKIRSHYAQATQAPAPQAAAIVGALRTVNTAEVVYASEHDRSSYSQALHQLGPPLVGGIPADLVAGSKSGYKFTYVPGPLTADGRIDTYRVYADPIQPGVSGTDHYYTDHTGVIRRNTAGRAGPDDPVVH